MKPKNTAPDRETALWLALLSGRHLGRRTAKEILNGWCLRDLHRLEELAGASDDDLAAALGQPMDVARRLQDALTDRSMPDLLVKLTHQQITVITRVDAAYPEELAGNLDEEQVPYLLFVRGDLVNLSEPGVAVAGAHEIEPLAQEELGQLAARVVGAGRTLIGGFERGTDRELLLGVAAAGGRAVAVLPMGLLAADAIIAAAEQPIAEGHLSLLSPFMPDVAYGERTAQARLPLITALADTLLLFEPDMPPKDLPGALELAAGGHAVIISPQDSAMLPSWRDAGALVIDELRELTAHLMPASPVSLAPEQATDALPGVEPIYFADAEEAIEVLGRSGRVPPGLAQRLRESSTFGYQDYEDIDVDPNEGREESQDG